jgi:hypothetical protein
MEAKEGEEIEKPGFALDPIFLGLTSHDPRSKNKCKEHMGKIRWTWYFPQIKNVTLLIHIKDI